jgi:hypothetical protein
MEDVDMFIGNKRTLQNTFIFVLDVRARRYAGQSQTNVTPTQEKGRGLSTEPF